MEFLEHVDFLNHNGVFLPMLNDVARNQFYDKILPEVRDQNCIEIGFGTGFLSMLALKHGARHIVAYESDQHRYELGQTVIKVLNLQDRITLINQRYDHTCEHDASVIFSETVDENLWGEGLFNSFPRQKGKKFLPGQYFFQIHAVPVVEDVALKLFESYQNNYFSPGVDIDPKFVSFINLLLSKKYQKPIEQKHVLPKGIMPLPLNKSLIDLTSNATFAGMYTVDTMAFVDNPQRELSVQIFDQPTLLIPRVGMRHHGYCVYLDEGHWPMFNYPVIVNQPDSLASIKHDLVSGKISYSI